jgi:hypothetical protein
MPDLEGKAAYLASLQRVVMSRLQPLPKVSATFTQASRHLTADVSWTVGSIPQLGNSSDGVKFLREGASNRW